MRSLPEIVVLIRGGGEMASAVAHRLHRSHFKVCLTEVVAPIAVSRGTTFSEAIFDGTKSVEGTTAELTISSTAAIEEVWSRNNIPILVDPECEARHLLHPDILVDARSIKEITDTRITDVPLVIGLGPGYYAGENCDAVVETLHDNDLGRVILNGKTKKDTKQPVIIGGLSSGRVIWAEQEGVFSTCHQIGEYVKNGQVIGQLETLDIKAPVDGMIRGLLRNGVRIPSGAKLIEIDPVNDCSVCYVIRDKWRAVAGGVLEAIMLLCNTPEVWISVQAGKK